MHCAVTNRVGKSFFALALLGGLCLPSLANLSTQGHASGLSSLRSDAQRPSRRRWARTIRATGFIEAIQVFVGKIHGRR